MRELEHLGTRYQEEERIDLLMTKLTEDYDDFVTLFSFLPQAEQTLQNLEDRLKDEYEARKWRSRRRRQNEKRSEGLRSKEMPEWAKTKRCNLCNRMGHIAKYCPYHKKTSEGKQERRDTIRSKRESSNAEFETKKTREHEKYCKSKRKSEDWSLHETIYKTVSSILKTKPTLDAFATKESAKCEDFFTQKDDAYQKIWQHKEVYLNPDFKSWGRTIDKFLQEEKVEKALACMPLWDNAKWFKRTLRHICSPIIILPDLKENVFVNTQREIKHSYRPKWRPIMASLSKSETQSVDDFKCLRGQNFELVKDNLLTENLRKPCYELKMTTGEINHVHNIKTVQWLLDSGANEHITNNRSLLQNYSKTKDSYIRGVGKTQIEVPGEGSVVAMTENGTTFEIPNVLYVPKAQRNILSYFKLVNEGMEVNLSKLSAEIGTEKTELKREGDLAFWNLLHEVNEAEVNHFHYSLGHPGRDKSALLEKYYGVKTKAEACDDCITAKSTRSPFPKHSENAAKKTLERVSGDIMEVGLTSAYGDKYISGFKDQYSHYIYPVPVASKSEAFHTFKLFIQNVGTPRILRTDNGGEYLSDEFQSFLLEKGIKHELTVGYSSQQNGSIERSWRTLMDTARANLNRCKLPMQFWDYAVLYAKKQLNSWARKYGTHRISSPHEQMFGFKEDITQMKVFGCDAFAHKLEHERAESKLSKRAEPYVFLGIPDNTKGYWLLNPKDNTVITRRDATFRQESFSHSAEVSMEVEDDPKDKDYQPEEEDEPTKQTPRTSKEKKKQPEPKEEASDSESETEEQNEDPSAKDPNEMMPPTQDPDQEKTKESEQSVEVEQKERRREKEGRPTRERKLPGAWWEVNLVTKPEPKTFIQAMASDEKEKWREAMIEEYQNLDKLGTWVLVPKNEAKNVIRAKWVYKRKMKGGEIDRYRARIVAKGFTQKKGIDYSFTFSPVARHSTTRLVIATAAQRGRKLFKVDIKNAYLNASVSEELYLEIPPGYSELMNKNTKDKVMRLKKSLYGLKQSARNWYLHLKGFLEDEGFSSSQTDPCLFIKGSSFILIYVDDVLIDLGSELQDFISKLKETYTLSEQDELTWHLGMGFTQEENETKMNQKDYIEEIAKKWNQDQSKPTFNPTTGTRLSPASNETPLMSTTAYKRLLGSLLWISVMTRPDVTYAVHDLCKQDHKPTKDHFIAAKRVLRYLVTTKDISLKFKQVKEAEVEVYSDSDWSGDPKDSKSTSGYVVLFNKTPISWATRKQRRVAMSTCEAEFTALGEAIKEALYITKLVEEMKLETKMPLKILVDNQSCIKISENPAFHARTKHIARELHFIRDEVRNERVKVEYVASKDNIADGFTKPLNGPRFRRFREMLMLGSRGSVEV